MSHNETIGIFHFALLLFNLYCMRHEIGTRMEDDDCGSAWWCGRMGGQLY